MFPQRSHTLLVGIPLGMSGARIAMALERV